MTINKAITWPIHAHMYCDQGLSSIIANWTKQVCHLTKIKWWGTLEIIWNRVPDRRRSKKKMNDHQVLPYCVQVYWEEAWSMSRCEWCGCAMAFYAACQRHIMVMYCRITGGPNKLFCMCFLHWQEANEEILCVWLYWMTLIDAR